MVGFRRRRDELGRISPTNASLYAIGDNNFCRCNVMDSQSCQINKLIKKTICMSENKQSVEEGNKLIMFFDGAEIVKIDILRNLSDSIKYKGSYYPIKRSPQFHKDWNLLMPVVEKIESICDQFYFTYYKNNIRLRCSIGGKEFDFKHHTKGIEAAWLAVIQTIQWYNQNKQS